MSDTPGPAPISAGRLAELAGDRLPRVEDVAPEAFALVRGVRELVEAVVLTDASPQQRAAIAREVAALTEELRRSRRDDQLLLVRHANGRIESLMQAGAGRLNPQALPIEFEDVPAPPPPGTRRENLELRAHCTLTAAHGGSPGRAHGGVVAALLDEVLGVTAFAAGATGFSVSVHVQFLKPTPYGVPLDIIGRYQRSEGRKNYVTGEIRAGGTVTATGDQVFLSERS